MRENGLFFGLYVWQRIMKSTEIEREREMGRKREKRREREREHIVIFLFSVHQTSTTMGWMQIQNGKKGGKETSRIWSVRKGVCELDFGGNSRFEREKLFSNSW